MKLFRNIHFWILLLLGVMMFTGADAYVLDGFDRLRDPNNQYGNVGFNDVRGIRNVMIRIFKSGGVALFVVALFVAIISVIRLLASENSEDDFKKWRDTLLWSCLGLLVIAFAYYIVDIFDVDSGAASGVGDARYFDSQSMNRIVLSIVYPLLSFLRYIAAFIFLFGAIYAYFRMVTAGGEQSGIDTGKRAFIYAVVGFILVILAEPFVKILYSGTGCQTSVFGTISTDCQDRVIDINGIMGVLAKIIVFLNSLVAVITLIVIIIAGFLVLTSGGNSDRLDRARKMIFYAIIGLVFLFLSYAIYRFIIYQA